MAVPAAAGSRLKGNMIGGRKMIGVIILDHRFNVGSSGEGWRINLLTKLERKRINGKNGATLNGCCFFRRCFLCTWFFCICGFFTGFCCFCLCGCRGCLRCFASSRTTCHTHGKHQCRCRRAISKSFLHCHSSISFFIVIGCTLLSCFHFTTAFPWMERQISYDSSNQKV